jgi:putative membrane protein (TIGR04086 family)
MLLSVGAAWMGLATFFSAPDPTYPLHLVLLGLLLAATAVGGFVAARIAEQSPLLNGMLVGVTGILAGVISNPGIVAVPRLLVIVQALSLVSGALGGLLAHLVARR